MMTQETLERESYLATQVKDCGCQKSFGQLYQLFYSSIFDYITMIIRDYDIASDLTQETFITASQNIHKLKETRSFRLWIFQIAKHKAMRHFRIQKKQNNIRAIAGYLADFSDTMEPDFLEKEELYNNLEESLNRLKDSDKGLLMDKYYANKSMKDISNEYCIGLSAVKMKIHRARLKLEKEMKFIAV